MLVDRDAIYADHGSAGLVIRRNYKARYGGDSLFKGINLFKLLGLIGLGLGGVGTLLSSYADDKKLEALVDEKVRERLETTEEENEEV